MRELLTVGFLTLGAVVCLLAALAVLRMPDLFTRMHGATKSSTLGVGSIILAAAIAFGEVGTTTHAVLIIAFLLLTAPIAAHMIARAAFINGVPIWKRSVINESPERVEGGRAFSQRETE